MSTKTLHNLFSAEARAERALAKAMPRYDAWLKETFDKLEYLLAAPAHIDYQQYYGFGKITNIQALLRSNVEAPKWDKIPRLVPYERELLGRREVSKEFTDAGFVRLHKSDKFAELVKLEELEKLEVICRLLGLKFEPAQVRVITNPKTSDVITETDFLGGFFTINPDFYPKDTTFRDVMEISGNLPGLMRA